VKTAAVPSARLALLSARASTVLMVVLAVVQATLAGNFLGGQYDALALHAVGARAITIASVVQFVVLAWVWRRGGPQGLVMGAGVQTLLLVAEFAAGELRLVALHIPLGVLIVVGIVQLTTAIWRTPLPARHILDSEVAR
jgi:hypothetical protein